MKKRLLALFAACSMITTAVAGMVQTAYAAEPTVRIGVADGASDTQKILTLYYEGAEAVISITGQLTFTGGAVTINSLNVTIPNDSAQADKSNGALYFASYEDEGTSSADGSFVTAVITVPEDADITASFEISDFTEYSFADEDWIEYGDSLGTVSTVIPKKAVTPTVVPAAVTAVEKQPSVTGTGTYETQTADIYGVEITPNDETVTGAEISVGNKSNSIEFKTAVSGEGTVVFAVILASESGAALPELTAENVTPVTASID